MKHYSKLKETKISSQTLYKGILNVKLDEVKLVNNKKATRIYLQHRGASGILPVEDGYVLSPMLAAERTPMLRRVAVKVLESMLDPDDRIETASIDAILDAFEDGRPKSGYVANIQGNIAVSSNKQGVRIEPMAKFRTRRKRG